MCVGRVGRPATPCLCASSARSSVAEHGRLATIKTASQPVRSMSAEISPETVKAFEKYDKDGSGSIDKAELEAVLARWAIPANLLLSTAFSQISQLWAL